MTPKRKSWGRRYWLREIRAWLALVIGAGACFTFVRAQIMLVSLETRQLELKERMDERSERQAQIYDEQAAAYDRRTVEDNAQNDHESRVAQDMASATEALERLFKSWREAQGK